jgi:pimeloyl-ACP methyl ester carboxylesterase
VFVPGISSVGNVVFAPMKSAIEHLALGKHELITVNLPSVDTIANKSSIKPTALAADIQAIRQILTRLILEEGRLVILVAHSYGGTPALSAAEGLWHHQRKPKGQLGGGGGGGVVRAGLISSSLALPGGSVAGDIGTWLAENNLPGHKEAKFDVIDDVSVHACMHASDWQQAINAASPEGTSLTRHWIAGNVFRPCRL